jgi:ABC-type polysaccharide/polyol phosphate export permease
VHAPVVEHAHPVISALPLAARAVRGGVRALAPWAWAAPLPRLWHYRALLRNLVEREVRVRYRNSAIGLGWSLLSPLLMMLVFTFVFSVLLHAAPSTVPYPVFLLVGILPWNFHATSVMGSLMSITGNAVLVSKVNFPRETLPLAVVLSNGVNFLLALAVLLPLLLLFGITPSETWLLLPTVMVGQLFFVIGVSLVVASVNVHFRDTEYIADILLLAWLFLTPIFYDISQVFTPSDGVSPADVLLLLNPMAAYITQYREILLLHTVPDPVLLARSIAIGLVTCAVGMRLFNRLARGFGDVL